MLTTIAIAAAAYGLAVLPPAPPVTLDGAQLAAALPVAMGAFRDCLTRETVRLGEGNAEPAETVLRAANAACRPVEAQLRALFAASPIGDGAWAERLISRDRALGGDDGVAALLASRAER